MILARHGESEFSARGLVNGDPGVAGGLTPAGVEQAHALGRALAEEELDLCVTSAFQRVRETADLALAGRNVPRVILDDLGDPNYGVYEGGPLDDYREWTTAHPSGAAPDGGESRIELVTRYTRSFRIVLARSERRILVVGHSIAIAYLLGAREGTPPAPCAPVVVYATPYPFTRAELERSVEALEAWCAVPTW